MTFLCIRWVCGDPSTTFLETIFHSKKSRKLRFHVFLHFIARKHMISSFYLKWIKFTRNDDLICFLTWNRRNKWNPSFLAFFEQKWSPKIYYLGPLGPKTKLFLQCNVSFWTNKQNFWIKLLHLSVFLVKQYASLKELS